jgi:hypothetical protein
MRINQISGDKKNVRIAELSSKQEEVMLKMQFEMMYTWQTAKGTSVQKLNILNRTAGESNALVDIVHWDITRHPNPEFSAQLQYGAVGTKKYETVTQKVLSNLIASYRREADKVNGKIEEDITVTSNSYAMRKPLYDIVNDIKPDTGIMEACAYIDYTNNRYHVVLDRVGKFYEEFYYYTLGGGKASIFYFGKDVVNVIPADANSYKSFKSLVNESVDVLRK